MKPKITKFGFAVFIYIFNAKFNKILLIKRNSEKRMKYGVTWGSVGGKIKFGEFSFEACLREIEEEIGINIDPKMIKLIQTKEFINKEIEEYAVHFRYCSILSEDIQLRLNDESDEYRWFSLSNLPKSMFESQEEINSFKSLAIALFSN